MSLAALRNLLADLVTQAGGPRTPALNALNTRVDALKTRLELLGDLASS
jgi:hypothetical protein